MDNLNFKKDYKEYHIMNKDEIVGKIIWNTITNSTAKFKSALKLPHNIERLLNFKFKEHPLVDNKRLKYLENLFKEEPKIF